MPCCVTAVRLCKIIEKSVVGASFVFCPEELGPRLDSPLAQESRIANRVENQDSQQIVNLLLKGAVSLNLSQLMCGHFTWTNQNGCNKQAAHKNLEAV